jgi:IclR family KDG regulon transcriptional repressor
MKKTTAHRLLQSLLRSGYVSKSGTPVQYSLNLKLWTLANAGLQQFDIREWAKPKMVELGHATREAVHLSMLLDDKVVCLDKVDSDQPLQAHTPIGSVSPAHCLATGKAILAYMGDDYIDARMKNLSVHTTRTLRTNADLKRALAKVREQGYATSVEEWHENVVGIAAPILDVVGRPVAAVGIAAPADRLSGASINRVASNVITAAQDIAAHLGRRERRHRR